MANAADIIVNLVAKTGRFQSGMKKGQRSMGKFQKSAKRFIGTLAKTGVALTALGALARGAVFTSITKQAIEANQELGQFATRLGLAADELKVLQIAAELSGQTTGNLTIGLQRMTRRIAEAAVGTGEAKQALIDLGLSAQKLSAMTPDEQFRSLAEAMGNVANQGQRIQLGFKLLDTEGVGLVNTMKLLQEAGFKDTEKAARDMNAVLDEFEVAQFEAAQQDLVLMRLGFEGIRNEIGLQLLPAVKIMSTLIQSLATDAATVTVVTDSWPFNFVRSIGAIAGVLKALTQVFRAIAIIGSALVTFFLKPLAKVEEGWNRIADLVPGIDIDADKVGLTGFIKGMEQARTEQLGLLNEGLAIVETMDKFSAAWLDAANLTQEQAQRIQEMREEMREVSAEMQRQLDIRKKAATAEADTAARLNELNSLLTAGQAKSLTIALKIAKINENLISGEFLKTEKERNAALVVRAALMQELIDAQQEEQGIETATEAAKRLEGVLKGSRSEALKIAEDIAVINRALAAGTDGVLKTEEQRNAALRTRAELMGELVEAQQKEQGIQTATEAATELAQVLERGTKQSTKIAREIAVLNKALVKGEGDRNEIMRARKVLIDELIAAQVEEQTQVSKMTQVGIQALRNMQDILADFFANTKGGFRGLVDGFTDMLKKMVAQLLARRILLSFLGLFSKGSGAFAQFARGAITGLGLAAGGAVAAREQAIVGEERPEVFIPKNVLTFPTASNLPGAVARDVEKRHEEGTLPTDQLRMIGKRGSELFAPTEAGTVVPTALLSSDVLKDIEKRQSGGPLAAGQASVVGEAGPELFIPQKAGQVIPAGGFGNVVVNIEQRNSFAGSGPLEPATLIPLLEENNRKLKGEFVDELRRGTFA